MHIVYVVVNFDLGWDNIVGVFDSTEVDYDELSERFPEKRNYYIHHVTVETNLDAYD